MTKKLTRVRYTSYVLLCAWCTWYFAGAEVEGVLHLAVKKEEMMVVRPFQLEELVWLLLLLILKIFHVHFCPLNFKFPKGNNYAYFPLQSVTEP